MEEDENLNENPVLCPKCGSRHIIENRDTGEIICSECGLVIDRLNLVFGDEAFHSTEEMIERSRAGPLVSPLKPSYGLTTTVSTSTKVSRETLRTLRRVRKYVGGKERNVSEALHRIRSLGNQMNIPSYTLDYAAQLYRKISFSGLMKGRNMDAMVAAVIYAACLQTGVVRSLKDVATHANVRKKIVGKYYRTIFKRLGIRAPPPKPEDFIDTIRSRLNLPICVTKEGLKIIKLLREEERSFLQGKNPLGISAAVIYYVTSKNNIYRVISGPLKSREVKLTQLDTARAAGITEVTLRNVYRELIHLIEKHGYSK